MFDRGWQCCANSVCVEVLTSGILHIMVTKKIYSGDVVQREYYNDNIPLWREYKQHGRKSLSSLSF